MEQTYLFDRLAELKEKFSCFFQHHKQIKALENFSYGGLFHHRYYLELVKHCMKEGFLGEKEAEFLTYMLERYKVNYLDWAHKTKWLKERMKEQRQISKTPKAVQSFFNFEVKTVPLTIPQKLIPLQNPQLARQA
jgi:hypothetical protein